MRRSNPRGIRRTCPPFRRTLLVFRRTLSRSRCSGVLFFPAQLFDYIAEGVFRLPWNARELVVCIDDHSTELLDSRARGSDFRPTPGPVNAVRLLDGVEVLEPHLPKQLEDSRGRRDQRQGPPKLVELTLERQERPREGAVHCRAVAKVDAQRANAAR